MSNEQYDPRPNGRFVTFTQQPGNPPAPYDWPQDTLRVPNGFGAMPLVNHLNANLNRREFFEVGANWFAPGLNSVNVLNLQVPKDGDFWCSGINTITIDPEFVVTTDQAVVSGYVAYLMIEDAITGYSLTQPPYIDNSANGIGAQINGSPWGAFETRNYILAGTTPTPFTFPFGGGTRTDMIQPYCFLRGGAIKVTLTVPPQGNSFPDDPPNPVNFHLSMVGWKEYAYAAP